MASLSALRAGIATRLQTISGLRVLSYVGGDIVPPAAVVIPGVRGRKNSLLVDYDATMGRGSDDWQFTVLLMVANKVERVSQVALDAYCDGSGSSSVKAAIEADGTLGGIASFTNVRGVRDYGIVSYGGQQYVGAEFMVEVCTQ